MSLKSELDAIRSYFLMSAPEDVRVATERADAELAASGVVERALKAGDLAPDFDLPNVDGRMVRLSTLLAEGPVVVSFYRGSWCPFCTAELKALQAVSAQIRSRGASLVAISPQTLSESVSTAEANALDFLILSDHGCATALGFGVAFDLAPSLRPIYATLGHALPDRNGEPSWRLPMPATFVIGRDGRVLFAHVDSDFRNRLDPDKILEVLGQAGASVYA